jgi:uncharacterized protein YjbI with pentapeptide repeats
MANQEHLDILRQGVEFWNEWKTEYLIAYPDTYFDLSGIDLREINLSRANLSIVDFSASNLSRAILENASLFETNFSKANLCDANFGFSSIAFVNFNGANLDRADFDGVYFSGAASFVQATLRSARIRGAYLRAADFSMANLEGANFCGTTFGRDITINDGSYEPLIRTTFEGANLSRVRIEEARVYAIDLSEADLSEATLTDVNFIGTNLNGTNFRQARIGGIQFANLDLSQARGLETVYHQSPSTIGIDTIYRSGGNIPKAFLRGAGIDDTFIVYIRSIVNKPIEYYTCFISYSNKDQVFAERLYADLQNNNVRCWYAPEDLKIGDKFRVRINESIRLYDKLLLILSEHSVASEWVEKEVEAAFEKEHQSGKLTLFPIKLDNTVMETDHAWAADIRRMRHIGDFTRWKEHDEYQKGLNRLLRDLKQEAIHDTIESDADKDQKQSNSREIES